LHSAYFTIHEPRRKKLIHHEPHTDSPAICPYSWTSAHTFTSLFTGDASRTVVPLGPETTAVLCCPPGYVKGIWGHRCTSTVTVDQVLRYVAPRLDGTGYDRGETKETTIEQETRVIGDGVPIWWQASDLPVLEAAAQMTPTSMPPSASTSGAPSEGSAPTLPENTSASDAERNQSSSSSGGLTTGGKIGLGVGLPIAILLGLFIGYMFARRRRAKKIGGGDSAIPSEMAQHENGGVGAGKSAARYELKSDPVFEMDGGAGGKVELPASVELPAEAEADTEAGRTTRTV
jgi:hypothetical protein